MGPKPAAAQWEGVLRHDGKERGSEVALAPGLPTQGRLDGRRAVPVNLPAQASIGLAHAFLQQRPIMMAAPRWRVGVDGLRLYKVS